MRIKIICLTDGGERLARRLGERIPDAGIVRPVPGGLKEAVAGAWRSYDGLVFIMSAGIVVRVVSSLLADKRTDPAVVVLDEKGRFAVSLLSGHIGGANRLAERVAKILDGTAVITTASDTLCLTALDEWADEMFLSPYDPKDLTRASAILVNNGFLSVYASPPLSKNLLKNMPPDLRSVGSPEEADLIISNRVDPEWKKPVLRPRNLVLGIGCNRGTPAEEIAVAVDEALERYKVSPVSVREIATIDLKRDEPGLITFADEKGWTIRFFGASDLSAVSGVAGSEIVRRATGTPAVAEPAALLAAGEKGKLLGGKMKWKNVTVAIAEVF